VACATCILNYKNLFYNLKLMKHDKFVNGPVNVVRLEGEVDGIKKVLYVFMDFHMDISGQTKCEDIRSKDINTYFVENFDKISDGEIIYDFFFEIFPTSIVRPTSKYKVKYIWEIAYLFQKSFMINREKNIVGKSNNFPNVRLHYIDIRDYLIDSHKLLYQMNEYVDNIIYSGRINKDNIITIRNGLNMAVSNVKIIYDILYGKTKTNLPKKYKPIIPKTAEILTQYKPEDFMNNMKILIDKIRNKYTHKDIKNILNKIIDNEIYTKFNEYFEHINKYMKTLDQIEKELNITNDQLYLDEFTGWSYGISKYHVLQIFSELSLMNTIRNETEMDIFVYLIDVFFLRRFLEKDYVTNGISYTGALHSVNYIYILIKYFNFTITHYSYLKGDDIKKVIHETKESKSPRGIEEYFYPPILQQCSNMTDFPELFK
jgi:hypothetical protein